MTKVKELKVKKTKKRARITVKSLLKEVRKKLNKKKVEAVSKILEQRYKELDAAKRVVAKIQHEIAVFENKDIEEIDTEDYEYDESDE